MATAAANLDTGLLGEFQESLSANLPDDWEFTTLGEAFKWGSGGTPKRTNPAFYGGEIPWLIIGDLADCVVAESDTNITEEGLANSSAKLVAEGSVLLAMYGSIGKLGIAGRELATNQAIAFTKPEEDDAKYLFYYLMFVRNKLARLGKGATQKNISQTVIKAFPYVRAPLGQQPRIVAEIEKQFSRLDEAVASLKRVKANLKRYKAAVLNAAVEGKLTEEWRKQNPGVEPASKLLERILAERRTKWEEAELAKMKAKGKEPKDGKWKEKYKEPPATPGELPYDIPATWSWARLDAVFDVITDGDHQAPPKATKGVPFLVIGNVNRGKLDFTETRFVPQEYFDGLGDVRTPCFGDLLYTVVGSYGIPVKVDTEEPFCVQRHIAILKPSRSISLDYLYYAMASGLVFSQATDVATGTAQKTVPLKGLRGIVIPVPPISEQKAIVLSVDAAATKIEHLEGSQVLARASVLRQAVLANAFGANK